MTVRIFQEKRPPSPPELKVRMFCVRMENSGLYTVLKCNLHALRIVLRCSEPPHGLHCNSPASIFPLTTLAWTSQEEHSVFCVNFILRGIVVLIKPPR